MNKYELKKYIKYIILTCIISVIGFVIFQNIQYKKYIVNTNTKVLEIIDTVKNKYPNITDEEILKIINNKETKSNFKNKYSIDIDKLIKLNDNHKYNIFITIYFIISLIIIIFIFLKYNHRKDKDIKSITRCIEEINKKNYKLDLDDMSEDELSILKNEIYKTTIMLKEEAENSLNDKIKLKDSLSDISHQLKTPLTSIMIMLDNLIDHPDMKEEIRDDFIREIKREINNINFLVQNILKLSKFDSNTVEYINKKIKTTDLVNKSIKKLLPLCDLKNIKINIKVTNDSDINCDEMWQVEAISNVIKNCIEHSNNDNKVDILIDSNNVYNLIKIQDYGTGIDKNEISHIFERFYKGKNSDINSIGIGLALARTIIKKGNGVINVESEKNKGTTFEIKYYK